jgi:hypothetical protein
MVSLSKGFMRVKCKLSNGSKLTVRAKFIHRELHVNALLLLTITQALNGHKSIGHWADTDTVRPQSIYEHTYMQWLTDVCNN